MTLQHIIREFEEMTSEAKRQVAGGNDCRKVALKMVSAAASLGAQNREYISEVVDEGKRRIAEVIEFGVKHILSQGNTADAMADSNEIVNPEVADEGERRIAEAIERGVKLMQSQDNTASAMTNSNDVINMDNVVKLEIGQTVESGVWFQAADNLEKAFPHIAQFLLHLNHEGLGEENAEDFMAEATLALTALRYVGNFAADKCRFIGI